MTPAEHYREGERLLEKGSGHYDSIFNTNPALTIRCAAAHFAAAQVGATLAVATVSSWFAAGGANPEMDLYQAVLEGRGSGQ